MFLLCPQRAKGVCAAGCGAELTEAACSRDTARRAARGSLPLIPELKNIYICRYIYIHTHIQKKGKRTWSIRGSPELSLRVVAGPRSVRAPRPRPRADAGPRSQPQVALHAGKALPRAPQPVRPRGASAPGTRPSRERPRGPGVTHTVPCRREPARPPHGDAACAVRQSAARGCRQPAPAVPVARQRPAVLTWGSAQSRAGRPQVSEAGMPAAAWAAVTPRGRRALARGRRRTRWL